MSALPTAGVVEVARIAVPARAVSAGPEPVVDIRIDRKAFPNPGTGGERLILDRVCLTLRQSEFVALVGPSGCGKTTLLQIVAGLDTEYAGHIHWPGTRDGQRPSLGYVFQNPRLLPWLSLRDNIALVLPDPRARAAQIDSLIATMGLADVAHLHANRLSVGMQRRGALARAFAVEPRLLLMDEPFVSLDAPTAAQLRWLLLALCEAERPTVVFVTHDLREATLLADRVLFLSHSPSQVVGEAEVGLGHERRRDESQVDSRYRELKVQFQRLYGDDSERASPEGDR